MGLWSRCTLRWLLATGSGFLASKLSRLPLSQRSFARGRAQSNSTIPKLSSPWFTRRSGHHLGSWRPLTRHQGPTCLCNLVGWGMSSGLLDRSIFESFCQRPYQWMFLLGIVLFKNIRKTKELSLSMWFPKSLFCFHFNFAMTYDSNFFFQESWNPSFFWLWFIIFSFFPSMFLMVILRMRFD